MTDKLLMGIDIGTSQSKGVLCDTAGNIIAHFARDHGMDMPRPGWYEQDPIAVWWGDFVALSCSLTDAIGGRSDRIAGVAVSALGQDLLPVDRDGNPTRERAILYGIDSRAVMQEAEMNR